MSKSDLEESLFSEGDRSLLYDTSPIPPVLWTEYSRKHEVAAPELTEEEAEAELRNIPLDDKEHCAGYPGWGQMSWNKRLAVARYPEMFQFAKENKLHGDTVESIQRKWEEYQEQVQQDEDEKNKTGKYVPLPTPELKEVLMDYGYSGVKAGDMMEVIRKRYVDGSIYDQTGTNDLYYEGYLNESKDLTYLPQYIFSKEHAEPEKYSRRRTPTKWTKNKLRQGKHSAKEKLKKGTRWAKRQMGIQRGGQRKRRRRSKLTRGKHKTRKHKTRKKTRKRIKSRRP